MSRGCKDTTDHAIDLTWQFFSRKIS